MDLIIGFLNVVRVVLAFTIFFGWLLWPWGCLVMAVEARTKDCREAWEMVTLVSILVWLPALAIFAPIGNFFWPGTFSAF